MKKSKPNYIRNLERRRLIGALTLGGGAIVVKNLPERWTPPLVRSIILPAHAQTTNLGNAGPTFSCQIQGPNNNIMAGGGMGLILMTITPAPGPGIPIQAMGTCTTPGGVATLIFNVTLNFDFTTGQATVPVGPLAPPPTCNPGDTFTVALSATTVGGITANCIFNVV